MKVFCLKNKELFSIRVYHSLPAYDQWNRLEGTLCIYCRKGNFEMDIDGQGYRLKPGSIAICQPGSLVRFTDDSRNLEFVLILLSDELLADIRIPYPAYFMLFFKEHPFMVLQEGQLAGIEATLRAIERIYKDDKNRFRIPIATLHVQIFFLEACNRIELPGFYKPTDHEESLCLSFFRLVQNNYREQRALAFYADRLLVSERYLSWIVRIAAGTTPKRVVNCYILGEIKTFLKFTRISLHEISMMFSFSDENRFSRFFKKRAGISPNKYRQEQAV